MDVCFHVLGYTPGSGIVGSHRNYVSLFEVANQKNTFILISIFTSGVTLPKALDFFSS